MRATGGEEAASNTEEEESKNKATITNDAMRLRKRKLAKKSKGGSSKKSPKASKKPAESCDPVDVRLLDYPQWEAEKGYWIGEYTFLGGDGDAFVSSSWNYPYDHYKGFITGEVVG